ncbi:PQQ-binding-like beta-propeller repeat protein [Methanoculleus sp. Wushi-C6]|uniref:PQQ-binding-like beta-propeller repeat protein n=1 Tax=Methanoculleus caldifontis TaxID=2651577 RepID=A0ABU3WYV8_9EURY|nr:PQQ-binding-like beta-propeller repeat protein [Methanoculleus sp. Wushi-C6]MDV2480994.1 PQQ-binding-like beta-propeller repeat protein [Methanoculleus sp. Wushi-C6]
MMTDFEREDFHRLKRILVDGKTHAVRKKAVSLALLSLIVFTAVSGCLSSDIVGDRHDLTVTRTDAAGNEIWHTVFDEGGDEYGTILLPVSDGGLLVGGSVKKSPGSDEQALLLKIAEDGRIEWNRSFPTRYGVEAVAAHSDGNFTAGTADGSLLRVVGDGTPVWSSRVSGSVLGVSGLPDGDIVAVGSKNDRDVWVAVVNDTGSLLWEQTYSALGRGRALGVASASDGGCIVAGATDSHSLWVMRLDREGNVIWSRTFEEGPEFAGVTLYRVYSVREKPDSSVDLLYRVGRTLEGEAVGRSVTVDRSLDRDGSDMSVTEFYTPCPVARTSGGGYACACLESSQSDGYTFGNYLGSPIHIVRFDDRGEITRNQTGTRAAVNIVTDVVQTSDEGFAVLGMYTKT